MGTRNLICVFHESKFKVAQYSQWDGYPEGNGLEVLRFVHDMNFDRDKFLRQVNNNTRILDEEEYNQIMENYSSDGWMNMEQSARLRTYYPSLSRDIGAEILELIYEGDKVIPLVLQQGFGADSLFCEWAWVINLDTNELEAYKGFNKEEPTGLFVNESIDNDSEYSAVTLVKSWPLDALPTEEEFLATFIHEDDE